MLAKHREIDAVRRLWQRRFGHVFVVDLARVDPEATTPGPVVRQIDGHAPCGEATGGRPVLLVGLDRAHALVPTRRHEGDQAGRDHRNANASEQLLLLPKPEEDAHGGDRQQSPSRLGANRSDRGQQHHAQQAEPDHGARRHAAQVVHQRNHHHQRHGEFVVALDETTRWPPDPARPTGLDREDAALEPVEPDRQHIHPDEQLDVLSAVQRGQRHQHHQLDFQHLRQLLPGFGGVDGHGGRYAHPKHQQRQHDHRWILGHFQLVAGVDQRHQRGAGRDRSERRGVGKAPRQSMRSHQADPVPQQDTDPGVAHGEWQCTYEDGQQHPVTHGSAPEWRSRSTRG